MSEPGAAVTCTTCGAAVAAAARFCEDCGSPLTSGQPVAVVPAAPPEPTEASPLAAEDAPISALTRRAEDALPDPPEALVRRPCAECGGEVAPDLYCMECGTKALSPRDHFTERPAAWVAGVCDKGVLKSGNEDAMALLGGAEPGSRAVLVVLDGVSSSADSAKAALAGARAAREVLRMPLPSGMGTPQSKAAAAARVFQDAVKAANTAIVAHTDPDEPNPASATFTAAVLERGHVTVASIGDSRAYWLPDSGDAQLLTVDDSGAQAQIDAGVPREVAEASPQAHAITKWLGRDSEDPTPRVSHAEADTPGWLLVCSDGLWNYASQPDRLQAVVAERATGSVADLADALVAFAHEAGGHDNITVALARVGALRENATDVPEAADTVTQPNHDTGAPADG